MKPLGVLVIDDNELDRMLYRRTLSKSADTRYEVTEAETGEKGLQLIGQQAFACVLLDYSLPGRNGVEILKRIRAHDTYLPVIILTGQGNEAVAVAAMQEGAQNYISKSQITVESLERVIRIVVEYCAMHKRIAEQRASLEIFTRALAHDLKEPVRTIRSFLELIAAREPLSERATHYFTYIQKAAARMNMLIDTVYMYTRLDGTDQDIAREVCDLSSVLDDVRANLRALIEERYVVIACDPLPCVLANRMQMIQLLQNLIGNAIRHGAPEEPYVHISAQMAGDQWVIRVRDNGEGVEADHAESVFAPFRRMSRSAEGLGLGLAICRKIVESHHGKIWYEPSPQGAVFAFSLPAALPEQKTPAATNEPEPQTGAPALATLMLVEDNDADIELTRIMLLEEHQLHCNLIVARDGEEAMRLLQQHGVDLMLLDINMPGEDGFQLLARLKQVFPVIMCSTSTYDKDIERSRSLGASGYINKPAEIGKLKGIIEHLPGLRLRQETQGYTLLRAS